MELKQERTFSMIKPDGVKRGLVGDILGRIERAGLKIVAMELFCATPEMVDKHIPVSETWITRVGEKTLALKKQPMKLLFGLGLIRFASIFEPMKI